MRRFLLLLSAFALVAVLAVPAVAGAAPPSAGPAAPAGATSTPPAPAPPAELSNLTNARSVAVGYYHSCAILTTSQVRCWGYGLYGELGNGNNTEQINTAVVTKNASGTGPLTNVVQVALGDYHTCALLTNRQVRCWGENVDGQLGTGDNDDSNLPRTVRNAGDTGPLTNVIQLGAESDGMCALLSNHQVRCWGDNDYGQLGNDDTGNNSSLPVTVKGLNGTGALSGIASISTGYDTHCAVTQAGGGRCWGYTGDGALGNGGTSDSGYPVRVLNAQNGSPLTGITQIANGGYHGCARLANGQARCWGDNEYGELGSGGTTDNTRAVLVRLPNGRPLTGIVSITVGVYNSCALLDTGQVRCWGDDTYAENGDGTIVSPDFRKFPNLVRNGTNTGTLRGVQVLAGKSYHYCVVVEGGQVRCWGYGEYGHLGYGGTANKPLPALVRI